MTEKDNIIKKSVQSLESQCKIIKEIYEKTDTDNFVKLLNLKDGYESIKTAIKYLKSYLVEDKEDKDK